MGTKRVFTDKSGKKFWGRIFFSKLAFWAARSCIVRPSQRFQPPPRHSGPSVCYSVTGNKLMLQSRCELPRPVKICLPVQFFFLCSAKSQRLIFLGYRIAFRCHCFLNHKFQHVSHDRPHSSVWMQFQIRSGE